MSFGSVPSPSAGFYFGGTTFETNRRNPGSSPSDLGRDMVNFLKEHKDTGDVTFVVEGQEIKAHKCVLAARSTYFRNMLYGNMRESNDDRIPLDGGISADVFRKILDFLYADLGTMTITDWMNLLPFADMFQLDDLKSTCEECIGNSISDGNALHILRTSHATNASGMATLALNYIYTHARNPTLIANVNSLSVDSPEDAKIMQSILLHIMNGGRSFSIPTGETSANALAFRAFGASPFGNAHR